MEASVIELETILEKELIALERLLAAARSMNEAIKREDVGDVRKANKEYDECTCHIESLEEKRLSISDAIALHVGLQGHVNLLRTIELLPSQHREKLSELRSKLRSALSGLQKVNSSNRILLTESLFTITKTFEFIAAASEKFSGYKRLGKKDSSKINRTIINTVA
jgi:flagellar biosynthesis/type III secretory pathway chaperone